jgi:site-specific DNA-methyltransferase (adenine-specific)
MAVFFSDDDLTLHHDDCLGVLPTLADESVDLVLTDPPYLVGFKGRWDGARQEIRGDRDPTWVRPVFLELFRVLKRDSFAVSFYGWPHVETFAAAWRDAGYRLVSHLAFVKNVIGLGRMTRSQHETAYLLAKGRPRLFGTATSDVIEWAREADAVHPCQKPVAALVPLILNFAPEQGLVLDPFSGSESTLLAARECGSRAIGIEIEERFCEFSARRLAQRSLFKRRCAEPE